MKRNMLVSLLIAFVSIYILCAGEPPATAAGPIDQTEKKEKEKCAYFIHVNMH